MSFLALDGGDLDDPSPSMSGPSTAALHKQQHGVGMSKVSLRNFIGLRDSFEKQLRGLVADEIGRTFPGPSENAVCESAAHVLGMTPPAVRALLRRQVQKPNFAIVLVCRAYRGVDAWAGGSE